MYEFQLVNEEINESRLFRTTGSFGNLTGRTIADLLYLQTLMMLMFIQDKEQRDYGVKEDDDEEEDKKTKM